MPLWLCKVCGHEWEYSQPGYTPICAWCYQDDKSIHPGVLIQEQTPLEKLLATPKTLKQMLLRMSGWL